MDGACSRARIRFTRARPRPLPFPFGSVRLVEFFVSMCFRAVSLNRAAVVDVN